jgi:hypothetical protein
VWVVYNTDWFTLQGGYNVVKSSVVLTDVEIIDSGTPGYTVHPNSIATDGSTILRVSADGSYMIADESTQGSGKLLFVKDGVYGTTTKCIPPTPTPTSTPTNTPTPTSTPTNTPTPTSTPTPTPTSTPVSGQCYEIQVESGVSQSSYGVRYTLPGQSSQDELFSTMLGFDGGSYVAFNICSTGTPSLLEYSLGYAVATSSVSGITVSAPSGTCEDNFDCGFTPTSNYSCSGGTCIEDVGGLFTSLEDCQASCSGGGL